MKKNIINKIALTINYLLHPLFLTTVAVVLIFNSGYYLNVLNPEIKKIIYSIFIISTFFLPVMFIPILYYFGIVSSVFNQTKNDTIITVIIISIIYALAYYFMSRINMPPILIDLLLSIIILLIVSVIIYMIKEFSLFTMGWGAFLGLVFYLAGIKGLSVLNIFVLIIILSGIIGSVRLYLKKNTNFQVYFGYLIGFTCFYLTISILL